MFSPFPAPRCGKRAGFTLIELLVVVSIIGVLAGILLPVMGAVQNRARKVQAVNDIRNTKTAIFAYYGDYHQYPIPQPAAADVAYGDASGTYQNAVLFNILRAVDDGNNNQNNQLNVSQNVYWGGKFATNATKPREGITTQDVTVNGNTISKGSLVDPWGNPYWIYVDGDRNGDLSAIIAAHQYTDAGTITSSSPPLGVAFASLGPDGKFGTKGNGVSLNSDDIVSWQQ